MKRIVLICLALLACLATAGCGAMSRLTAKWTGYEKICIEGVYYLQFTSGAAVQVDRDGKPVACNVKWSD